MTWKVGLRGRGGEKVARSNLIGCSGEGGRFIVKKE